MVGDITRERTDNARFVPTILHLYISARLLIVAWRALS